MMEEKLGRFSILYGHVIMRGIIRCVSGLHIGGSDNSIQIGGVNNPIIRNPLTGEPYIPGSSLKGKLRSTMEKWVKKENSFLVADRCGDERNKSVYRHECDDAKSASNCPLCRIFGSTGKEKKNEQNSGDFVSSETIANDKENSSFPSNIIVRDCLLYNYSKMSEDGLFITEAKTENTLDRITAKATPRTMERVPAGAEFSFEIILKVSDFNSGNNSDSTFGDKDTSGDIDTCENKNTDKNNLGSKLKAEKVKGKIETVKKDLENLLETMKMIELDGIGGNVSRGYGKVKLYFNEFRFDKTPSIKEEFHNNKELEDLKSINLIENELEPIVKEFSYGCRDEEVRVGGKVDMKSVDDILNDLRIEGSGNGGA